MSDPREESAVEFQSRLPRAPRRRSWYDRQPGVYYLYSDPPEAPKTPPTPTNEPLDERDRLRLAQEVVTSPEVVALYRGQWLAICGKEIVAHGDQAEVIEATLNRADEIVLCYVRRDKDDPIFG